MPKGQCETVPENQKHLTVKQRKQLTALLITCDKLFSGDLGLHPHKKSQVELVENVQPVHKRACPVSHANSEVFKNEAKHLVELGALS
jgi:hypothetical protein